MPTIQVRETCDNRKQMYQRVHALQAAGRKGVQKHIDYDRTKDTNQPYRVYWIEYPATVPDEDESGAGEAMVSEGGAAQA